MADMFVDDETEAFPVRHRTEIVENEVKDDPQEVDVLHPASKFITVKLSSLGKLNAPPIIHIRNFNMDDAIELSVAGDDKLLEQTITTLNGMIKEGFDCSLLHEDELKELLLTIYANFWNSELSGYEYPWEEDELEGLDEDRVERILSDKEKLECSISINKIKTSTINEKFKEPIKITKDELTITFRLPRIKDLLVAKEYVENKYAKQDKEFSNIEAKLKEYDTSEWESVVKENFPDVHADYYKYRNGKQYDMIRVMQSQLIEKVAKTKLDTIEKKLDAYKNIDFGFWSKYNEIVREYAKFGIDEEVEVISPLTHKPTVRRFQFRFMDFIRSLELPDNAGYTVEFGV